MGNFWFIMNKLWNEQQTTGGVERCFKHIYTQQTDHDAVYSLTIQNLIDGNF